VRRPVVQQPDVLARWSSRKLSFIGAGFVVLIFAVVLLAGLDPASGMPVILTVLALLSVAGAATRLVLAGARSDVVLTRDQLRVRGRHGHRRISLDEVHGIAVVYAPPGWAIFVWLGSEPAVRLRSPERVFRLKAQSRAPMTTDYWQRVAESPAGVAARQIYEQARSVQDPAGALATKSITQLVARDRASFHNPEARWWSPSGECGQSP